MGWRHFHMEQFVYCLQEGLVSEWFVQNSLCGNCEKVLLFLGFEGGYGGEKTSSIEMTVGVFFILLVCARSITVPLLSSHTDAIDTEAGGLRNPLRSAP